jgi:hypothetical protein
VAGAGAAEFEEVVFVAGGVVAFKDFGGGGDFGEEGAAVFGPFEGDGDEGGEAAADDVGIDEGGVAFDDAAFFEFADAFGGGGGGEAEEAAELGPGGAGVDHKFSDYFRIVCIKHDFFRFRKSWLYYIYFSFGKQGRN